MAAKLGELLLESNQVSTAEVQAALHAQVVYGGRIGTLLVEQDAVGIDEVSATLARQKGVPEALFEDVDEAALESVPREMADKYKIVPLRFEGAVLHLAMLDPDPQLTAQLQQHLQRQIVRCVAPELRIMFYLENYYGVLREARFLRPPGGGKPWSPERRRYAEATVRPAEGEPRPATPPAYDPTADYGLIDLEAMVAAAAGNAGAGGKPAQPAQPQPQPVQAQPQPAQPQRQPAQPQPVQPQPRQPPQPVAGTRPMPQQAPAPEQAPQPVAGTQPSAPQRPVRLAKPSAALPEQARQAIAPVLQRLAEASSGSAIAKALVQPVFDNTVLSVLFWVKGKSAIGCCARGSEASLEELQQLVVSLEDPSLLQWSMQTKGVVRSKASNDGLQARIAGFLGTPVPTEVCLAPVLLRGKVVNLLCIHSARGAAFGAHVPAQLRVLAEAAAEAYGRLAAKIAK